MLRHSPVLAAETFANLPTNLHTYFDGTFGHGGHVEYILSHLQQPLPKVIACDLDETVQKKGLEFTKEREKQITPVLSSYAKIDQI
jgi:16S rRNA C1402 N4-methylase RsmH